MQKLLELLYQYDDEEWKDLYEWEIEWEDIIWYNRFWWWYETIDVSKSVIISKRYWFIERLVIKDKIDEITMWRLKVEWKNTLIMSIANKSDFYLCLLMLLSIQEEPVSFLIALLK